MERAKAAYLEILRRYRIPASKNLINLITKAINQNWGTTLFIARLRHTPEYREQFPGLRFDPTLTEASYNARYFQYRNLARSIGETLDRKTFAKILKRGITPELFETRIKAIQSVETWGPMWQGFQEALAARGITPPQNKQDLVKFVMRLGDKRWEKVWQETQVTTNLERVAGIDVGDKVPGWAPSQYAIDRKDLLAIINSVESLNPGFEVESISGQQWRDIGARLRQFDPSYLKRNGIETKDIIEMELGGPRAAAIASKADRVLKTQQAFAEDRATPQQPLGAQEKVPNSY